MDAMPRACPCGPQHQDGDQPRRFSVHSPRRPGLGGRAPFPGGGGATGCVEAGSTNRVAGAARCTMGGRAGNKRVGVGPSWVALEITQGEMVEVQSSPGLGAREGRGRGR